MHTEILSDEQKKIMPIFKNIKDFYLAGGTALALQLGHRKSIDFDFFINKIFTESTVLKYFDKNRISRTFVKNNEQITFIYDSVKITFLHYPFEPINLKDFNEIKIAKELDIAAMKAYALGRRSKWKDYVDLYFMIKKYGLKDIIERAKTIFKGLFNDNLFRQQLAYFDDIDYSEEVEYMDSFEMDQKSIKEYLSNQSLQ